MDNIYKQYMYSYPHKTAYEYSKQIPLHEYQEQLLKNPATLYFHIPFCESKCGYCNLFSIPVQDDAKIDDYIEAVKRHSDAFRNILNFTDVIFESVIFGGGTPLLFSIEQLEKLFNTAIHDFNLDLNIANIGIETSPNQAIPEKLVYLKSKGVNRISIGVQSFVESELSTLERFHGVRQVQTALKAIKDVQFDTLNIDLIYGIPYQTIDSLKYSLGAALEYEPDEIFVYPLYQKPNTGIYKKFEIDRSLQYRMYSVICDVLKSRGYFQTSMRRFVKNQLSKEGSCGFENMISLGCGGRSYIGNLHFCESYSSKQFKCRAIIDKYIKRNEFFNEISFYKLDQNEMKRRFLIKNLFYYKGVDLSEYQNVFGNSIYDDFSILYEFAEKGWTTGNKDKLVLTPLGLSLSDYIGPMLMSETVVKKMESFCDD